MNRMIKETKDYDRFELLPNNRDVKKIKYLETSMRKHGWISAYPMHVIYNGVGKLKIRAGHHRFQAARKLGIPIKYVVCSDDASVYELEKATTKWSINDFLTSFVRLGNPDYIAVKEYHERTGIGLMSCIAMLGGESASSHNKIEVFKTGNYCIVDQTHANIVAGIVLYCKRCGIQWAGQTGFVRAVSRVAWVEEFDPSLFKQKIYTYTNLFEKQPNQEAYVEMIDSIYNRQSRSRIPLKFLADEMARQRSAIPSN